VGESLKKKEIPHLTGGRGFEKWGPTGKWREKKVYPQRAWFKRWKAANLGFFGLSRGKETEIDIF